MVSLFVDQDRESGIFLSVMVCSIMGATLQAVRKTGDFGNLDSMGDWYEKNIRSWAILEIE